MFVLLKGQLTKLNYCINSPRMGELLCEAHKNGNTAPVLERLDTGVLRRKKRKEMVEPDRNPPFFHNLPEIFLSK